MKVPKTLNDITVEDFQRCYKALKNGNTLDDWFSVLSILTVTPTDDLMNLPTKEIHALIEKVSFIKEYEKCLVLNDTLIINNKPYHRLESISEGAFTQLASIKTVCTKGDSIENLHIILGAIYSPYTIFGKEYDILGVANEMKQAKVGEVLGGFFLYSKILKTLNPLIQGYLMKAKQAADLIAHEQN